MALDLLMSDVSGQASDWPDGLTSSAHGPDTDNPAFRQAMADAHASADADVLASEAGRRAGVLSDAEPPPFSLAGVQSALGASPTEDAESAPSISGRDRDHGGDAVEAAAYFLFATTIPLPEVAVAWTDAPTAGGTPPTSDNGASSQDGGALVALAAAPFGSPLPSQTEKTLSPEPIEEESAVALPSEMDDQRLPSTSLSIFRPPRSLTWSADAVASGVLTSLPAVEHSGASSLTPHGRALLLALKEQSAPDAGLSELTGQTGVAVPRVGTPSPEVAAAAAAATPESGLTASSPGSSPRFAEASTDSFTARSAIATVATVPLFAEPSAPGANTGQRDSREQSARERETLSTLAGSTAAPAVQLFSLLEQSAQSRLGALAAPESLRPSGHLPNEDAVAATLVRSMQLQYRNGVGTAVVNLDPEYLGAVTIALQIERGVVTATLHAANADVRGWMQANESALRQGLAAQGLSLERLIVSEEERQREQPSEDGRRRPSQEEERQRRQSRRAGTRTFEVVV